MTLLRQQVDLLRESWLQFGYMSDQTVRLFNGLLEIRKEEMMSAEINAKPLTDEAWREYDFGGRTYRIDEPLELYMRSGGTTHRIADSKGVVHCVPAPGHMGCVLRWLVKDGKPRVSF